MSKGEFVEFLKKVGRGYGGGEVEGGWGGEVGEGGGKVGVELEEDGLEEVGHR